MTPAPTPPTHGSTPRCASTSRARGASFYRELLAAAFAAPRTGRPAPTRERELLDALWDLVWAGEVTNDTFAPLRALRWPRRGRATDAPPPGRRAASRMGPPEAAGRWSLVVDDARSDRRSLGGRRATADDGAPDALATALLERHGVVTRDAVAAEGVTGGFGAVYPVLREMEERGRVRRGYFVEGLGGAQFALPGAVDRLRAARRDAGTARSPARRALLLAATDPANPYGAALPWPRRPSGTSAAPGRVAGAYVVLARRRAGPLPRARRRAR